MRRVSRRAVLGGAVGGAVGLGVGIPYALHPVGATSTGTVLRSQLPLPPRFRQRLELPPVLVPTQADHYTITQRRARAEIIPGYQTTLWTYDGSFPGPTIESRSGRTVVVRHVNRLPVPTVVHLHGGRTPHDSDGYPVDYVYPPGWPHAMPMSAGDVRHGSRDYIYPLRQRAATLWYHDHRMDFTGPSVWRGLAGFHLVRDAEEDALRLPSGRRELPLMLTDRSFAADGSPSYPSLDPTLSERPGVRGDFVAGVLGDIMLVNGVPWPVTEVDRASYRLRLLNACNARRLSLRLDPAPDSGLVQIGTDGGLLATPLTHGHLELAPAQRFDVLVDFSGYSPGTRVTLRNDYGEGPMGDVMRFVVGETTDKPFRPPTTLSTLTPLRRADAVRTRTFAFHAGDVHGADGWLVGDEPFSPDRVAVNAKLGTVEIWRLTADLHHPVHVHLAPFQVLGRGQAGPGRFDAGWKDTIDLHPSEQAEIAIRFEGYPGKYVFHCHNLEHEDMAMMANFEVR